MVIIWRSSVFAHMVTTYFVLMAVGPSASHAYETWHVIDVAQVVCPKQGNILQESVIQIDYAPELIVDKYHVFSFLRVSKQQVNVTISVMDSGTPPQTVVPATTLELASFTRVATTCPCTGQGIAVLDMTDYGSQCKAWDKEKCEEINGRPTGQFCCESWCYVDKDCASGWESSVSTGKFFSYAACQASLVDDGKCPYPTAEEKKADPCNCIENPHSLFTERMKMSLTKSYGAKCDAHDYKSKTCDPSVGFYTANQVDAWCCKKWCYVSKECPSAIPSINEGVQDKLFWSEIVCDNEHPVVLKMLAQCPYKRMGDVVNSGSGSMEELCKCNYQGGLPIDLGSSFGIEDEAYGNYCYPWDALNCDKHWPGADLGMWCCTPWCYVDPKCPKANKDSRWSGGYISSYACKDTTDHRDAVSSCQYSEVCECTGSNEGLNSTWKKRLGADYGKKCNTHDYDCEAKWPGDAWGYSSRALCCASWCYVSEKCPLAEKSWTGASLFYTYDTCDDGSLKTKTKDVYDPLGDGGMELHDAKVSLEYDETQGKCKSVGIASGDSMCNFGLLEGDVCCASACGTCAGKNCRMDAGGADNCCKTNIMSSGVSCDTDGAPCVVKDPTKAKTAKDLRLTPDPTCATGVKSEDVCCAPTCASCGGDLCGAPSRGGPDNCCKGRIKTTNLSCKEAGPPCVIGDRRLSEEESFMGDWAVQSPEFAAVVIEASQDDRRFLSERQLVSESANESENESESESEERQLSESEIEERRLSARRRTPRGGGTEHMHRRRRRRRTPTGPRRRSTESADETGHQTGAPSRPSGTNQGGRAPPPPPPSPSPSGKMVSAARRRAPSPPPGKPMPVAEAARRRAAGIGGKRYSTQTSKVGGQSQGYGYTQKNQMQKNFGGQMPQKASYGYSGTNAAKKNDKVKMAMAAGGGVALGVGAYYAYNKYQDYKRAQDQSWCEHTKTGEFLNCNYCRKTYGMDQCREERSCFQGAGCSYTLRENVNRDDLMVTGFLPEYFTPPLIVKITAIKGQGLSQKDLKCDQASLDMAAKNVSEVAPMSFKPLMFLTLTQMEQLEDQSPDKVAKKAISGSGSSCRPGLLALTLALALGVPGASRCKVTNYRLTLQD